MKESVDLSLYSCSPETEAKEGHCYVLARGRKPYVVTSVKALPTCLAAVCVFAGVNGGRLAELPSRVFVSALDHNCPLKQKGVYSSEIAFGQQMAWTEPLGRAQIF